MYVSSCLWLDVFLMNVFFFASDFYLRFYISHGRAHHMGGHVTWLHDSQWEIPSVYKHFNFTTKQVPERRSRKVRIVDHIEMELGTGMSKIKFLHDVIILLNIICALYFDIFGHAIGLVLNMIAKMESNLNLRQDIPIELHLL